VTKTKTTSNKLTRMKYIACCPHRRRCGVIVFLFLFRSQEKMITLLTPSLLFFSFLFSSLLFSSI
jgi:hypothetical protein